jgi:hypothetical protein
MRTVTILMGVVVFVVVVLILVGVAVVMPLFAPAKAVVSHVSYVAETTIGPTVAPQLSKSTASPSTLPVPQTTVCETPPVILSVSSSTMVTANLVPSVAGSIRALDVDRSNTLVRIGVADHLNNIDEWFSRMATFNRETFLDTLLHSLPCPVPSFCHSFDPTSQQLSIFDIRHRVATPYHADTWRSVLELFDISAPFPSLVPGLRHGFLFGSPSPLPHTIISENHSSVHLQPEVVDEYITEELIAGRCSGPFTQAELEFVLDGPFRVSPLGLVEKTPGIPGIYRIIRDLSFVGDAAHAVNDELDSDDFPTSWGTFQQVAEFVSGFLLLFMWPLRNEMIRDDSR